MNNRLQTAAFSGITSLVLVFAGCGQQSSKNNADVQAARTAREAFNQLSVEEKRVHRVTRDDRRFVQIPGNEFVMTFHTDLNPEGTSITIEPDLLAMDNNSTRNDGHITLVPTVAFLHDINRQLPLIGGMEMPPVTVPEGAILNISDVGGMFKHLTDDSVIMMVAGQRVAGGGGHGIDKAEIRAAIIRSKEALGIPSYPDATPGGP